MFLSIHKGSGPRWDSSTQRSILKVTGYLQAQDYKEGSLVKTGDLLFEVDPRPFQAIVDQAKAQVDVADAQLTQARADVDAAKLKSIALKPLN
jgi:multidrug resistance efflux pump